MSSVGEKAATYFIKDGFCCAEGVWLALADSDSLSKEERDFGNKLAASFCGGTGAQLLCGALAGGVLTLGRWFGRVPGESRNQDLPLYTKALVDAFRAEFGHVDCLDLKPKLEDSAAIREHCKAFVLFVALKVEELLDKGLEGEDCG